MASKNDLKTEGHAGVFYREHSKRKVGEGGVRKDRQWVIVQKFDGVRKVSTLGWWEVDSITPGDAINKALEYKANHKWNKANPEQAQRPICKQDEDILAAGKADQLEKERSLEEAQNISFGAFFENSYLPLQQSNGKGSIAREESLFKYHIEPVIGGFSFKEIHPFHLNQLKKSMADGGQSPRSIHYALSLFRQVWKAALSERVTALAIPLDGVTFPKLNNKRERFFTYEEEDALLGELKERSPISCDMLAMSFDTGARWCELASLKWSEVFTDGWTARLLDTKNGRNRTIQIATDRVKVMLLRRKNGSKSLYVFPSRNGGQQTQVNRVIGRVIKELGFNMGIEDRRFHLGYHSSRHTCASRLAIAGIPLYTIKEIMGHQCISQTERYAHLMPSTTRNALEILNKRAVAGA